ncbi:hypothetical protein SLS62_007662 [Diatrype stigma]|uniref:Coupling of ubiquitin conjugation to ER degradation protein 1 n=1 Tax=Diatrype stigma TaxID=117547 RepID=A0AAN9YM34_9PEZI
MENEQISLPSLLVIVVLGALVVRYLFFSPAVSAQRPQDAASASRAREAVVERIQQMFPQVDRRTILWDLQRNGGNIAATTERILAGRLETPPARFQPPPPPPSAAASQSAGGGAAAPQASSAKAPSSKAPEPDLITRYKLQDRISAECAQQAEAKAKTKGWSSNRDERQATLQRRRDEMILAARRRMEAKIAAEQQKVGGGGGGGGGGSAAAGASGTHY